MQVHHATLPPTAQRLLTEAQCRAAAAIASDDHRVATLRALIVPLATRIQSMAAQASTASDGARNALAMPAVSHEVRACCAGLRGAALACGRDTIDVIVEGLGPSLNIFLSFVPSVRQPRAEPQPAR